MQELVDKLKSEAGLTDEQAKAAIATIKNYVVEKFPMLEGAVNNVFGNGWFFKYKPQSFAKFCLPSGRSVWLIRQSKIFHNPNKVTMGSCAAEP